MFRYFSIYFLFLVSLVAVDMLWLLVIAKKMYQDEMGDLMASEPNLVRVYRVLCKRGWDQSLGILPSN